MNVFLDTNIVLDFCDARREYFQPAAVIFQLGREGKVQLFTSATTIINSFYILRHTYPHDELYTRMKAISNECHISAIDKDVIEKSLSNIYPDFEDAAQYYSARSVHADVIVTRNKPDFVMAEPQEIKSPEEFLDDFFEKAD